MKKMFAFIAFALILSGCGNNEAQKESSVAMQDTSTKVTTTTQTIEQTTITTTTKKTEYDFDYDINIEQKMMFEDEKGNYDLFVMYYFRNVSGHSAAMWDVFEDIVYLDGVQCDKSYKEYDLNASRSINDAKEDDLILTDTLVGITIGYKLKNYNPDKKHDIVIQVTEPFHPKNVYREEKISSDRIQLRKWEE